MTNLIDRLRGFQRIKKLMTNPDHHWECRCCGRCFVAEYKQELVLIGEQYFHLSGPRLDGEQKAYRELEFTDDKGARLFAHVCGPMIFCYHGTRDPIITLDHMELVADSGEKIRPAVGSIRGSGRSVQGMKIKTPRQKTRRLELDD